MDNSMELLNIDIEWDEDELCWIGFFNFCSGGELIVRTITEEPTPPTEGQVKSWIEFERHRETINSKMLDSVLMYYQKMRPRYVAAGEEWAKGMPEIHSVEEIEKMIRLQQITISSPYENEEIEIGLLYTCDWDSEHGLGVVLKNSNIEKIGGADCAILF